MAGFESFLRIVAALYGLATAVFLWSFVLERPLLDRVGIWIVRAGFALHTLLVILRWKESGLAHPPWISSFEALLFFPWFAVLAELFSNAREGVEDHRAGASAGVAGLACALLVFAAFEPGHGVALLGPEFRGAWLWVHGLGAAIAFGWLASGALAALFGAIVSPVRTDSIQALFSFLGLLVVAQLDKARLLELSPFSLAAVALLAAHFIVGASWVLLHQPKAAHKGARAGKKWFELLADPEERSDAGTFLVRGLYFLAYLALVALAIEALATGGGKHRRALLVALAFAGKGVAILTTHRSRLSSKLADPEVLERKSYRLILQGLPVELFAMLAGSIWAFQAWGSYWNWEPKQLWAGVTILFFTAFLHQKSLARSKAPELAALALAALLAMLFAFVGVPILLPTLHAFAGG